MQFKKRNVIVAACGAVLGSAGTLRAAGTWDGGTPASPNTGGNWSAVSNWDDDALPGTSSAVVFGSVTESSTRTVTQDITAGTTIGSLVIQQSGSTGINKLSLSGNLTLSDSSASNTVVDNSASAFRVTLSGGAATNQAQLDLNGYSVAFPTGTGGNVAGQIKFNSASSAIRYTSTGHSTFNVFGPLNATADGFLGRDTTTNATGNFTAALMTGSSLSVSNSAVFQVGVKGRGSQTRSLAFTNAGAISVASGSTLREAWDLTTSLSSASALSVGLTIQAAGSMSQGGQLALRAFQGSGATGATMSVTNSGTWTIDGASATIKRFTTGTNSGTPAVIMPSFTVSGTGIFKGNSASDALEFDEEVADGTRRMTVTSNGTIAPGAGSAGAALTSVGSLTLKDINLTVGATTGAVVMDIAGTAAGQYDELVLATGLTGPAGAGMLDLSAAGDTLDLRKVNGFVNPGTTTTFNLISAGSVTGQFDVVKLGGTAFTANSLVVDGVGTYNLQYTPTAVTLSFTSVPEPASVGLIGLAGLGTLARRRRK